MNPHRDDVRRSFLAACGVEAVMLRLVAHGLSMLIKGDQVGALTRDERHTIRTAYREIASAEKRLRLLDRRGKREAE